MGGAGSHGRNTAVLKHASNVSLAAQALEGVFASAGFPSGVFTVLYLPSSELGPVLADPRIASVSLTGSTAAGESVGREAGGTSRRPCSSWAGLIRSSSSRMPTLPPRRRPQHEAVS